MTLVPEQPRDATLEIHSCHFSQSPSTSHMSDKVSHMLGGAAGFMGVPEVFRSRFVLTIIEIDVIG